MQIYMLFILDSFFVCIDRYYVQVVEVVEASKIADSSPYGAIPRDNLFSERLAPGPKARFWKKVVALEPVWSLIFFD